MPLIPNAAVLQRIATLPLATYQAGETVLAAGTKTGRLLILRKGAVTIEKEGTEIAEYDPFVRQQLGDIHRNQPRLDARQ